MEFDFSKLRGRMIEKCGSQAATAQKAGISPGMMSMKVNNKTPFSMEDIHTLCKPDILDIAPEQIGGFFYAVKFDESNQKEA